MTSKPLFLLLFFLPLSASLAASDLTEFFALDRAELRAAESKINELLEPGTARLLREPLNDAERYVVRRQQRLAAELNQRSAPIDLASGEQVQPLFWPVARASQVITGADGRAQFRCVTASAVLGRELPDFRAGNGNRGAVQ
ncbi:MAG: hypothetical protein AAGJ52_02555 [Pseudomonadota bacterium]